MSIICVGEALMRSVSALRLVVLAAVLCLCGCSSSNKGKIEGTKWMSLASTVKGQSLPAGVLQLEFGSDGSLVYKAGPQTFTGKYSLGMGDTVTLKLDQELSGSKNHAEKIVIDGDNLTMTDPDGTAVTFERARGAK